MLSLSNQITDDLPRPRGQLLHMPEGLNTRHPGADTYCPPVQVHGATPDTDDRAGWCTPDDGLPDCCRSAVFDGQLAVRDIGFPAINAFWDRRAARSGGPCARSADEVETVAGAPIRIRGDRPYRCIVCSGKGCRCCRGSGHHDVPGSCGGGR